MTLHQENTFITLTYRDEDLPPFESIGRYAWQTFIKRLRKQIQPKKIRYFMCGEYGEKTGRPHYHAIIFGHEFPDKEPTGKNQRGDIYYTSESLLKAWPHGHVTIGEANFDTAAYVARYIMKKQNGPEAATHYEQESRYTCVGIQDITAEFTNSSRNPGIAHDWVKKYQSDLLKGYITSNGKKTGIPKYYTDIIENMEKGEQYAEKKRINEDHSYKPDRHDLNKARTRENIQSRKQKNITRSI